MFGQNVDGSSGVATGFALVNCNGCLDRGKSGGAPTYSLQTGVSPEVHVGGQRITLPEHTILSVELPTDVPPEDVILYIDTQAQRLQAERKDAAIGGNLIPFLRFDAAWQPLMTEAMQYA